MLYSYETMLYIHKWLIFTTTLFFIVDCFLVFLMRKKDIQIDNPYFILQNKYGFSLVTILKSLFLLCLFYFLLNPPGNAGAVGAIAIVYSIVVIILLKDFIKKIGSVNQKRL